MTNSLLPDYLLRPGYLDSAKMTVIAQLASLSGAYGGVCNRHDTSVDIPVPPDDCHNDPFWSPVAEKIVRYAAYTIGAPLSEQSDNDLKFAKYLETELADIYATEGVSRDLVNEVLADDILQQGITSCAGSILKHITDLRARFRKEGPSATEIVH